MSRRRYLLLMASDQAQQYAINLRAFVRNLRIDRDANENFARAQMKPSRSDEKDHQSRFIKRIRDARRTMEQSILDCILLFAIVKRIYLFRGNRYRQ